MLQANRVPVTFREIESPWGHDSFLLVVPEYHRTVAGFLDRMEREAVNGARRAPTPGEDHCDLISHWWPAWSRAGPACSTSAAATARCSSTSSGRRGATATGSRSPRRASTRASTAGFPSSRPTSTTASATSTTGPSTSWSLSQTLQATRRPALVLVEMMRVAPAGIVSFPNFGHWRIRLGLLGRGRMPSSRVLPYAWHDTPNIHLCTLRDFEELAAAEGLRLTTRVPLNVQGGRARAWVGRRPNLLAAGVVCRIEHRPSRSQDEAVTNPPNMIRCSCKEIVGMLVVQIRQ